jgi:hypothetical protein
MQRGHLGFTRKAASLMRDQVSANTQCDSSASWASSALVRRGKTAAQVSGKQLHPFAQVVALFAGLLLGHANVVVTGRKTNNRPAMLI